MAKSALVVDDSMAVRQLVSFTLKEAGFEVREGSNGQEALDQLEKGKVDLIITDLNMPVMDGITLSATYAAVRQTSSRRFCC
jgi:two-component system chemotaxis response regulator CheY